MQFGMIGLGRMGAGMVRRLMRAGHACVVYDRSAQAAAGLTKQGATGASSISELVKKLDRPRHLCLMIPAVYVDVSVDELVPLLEKDDTVIDGGNSHYHIFVDADAKQGAIVGRLQTTYPVLNVPSKPIHADPWCLALTQLNTTAKQACYLINEERDTAQASDKLPWLCKDLGLKWARLLDIPGLEGLRFTLSKV